MHCGLLDYDISLVLTLQTTWRHSLDDHYVNLHWHKNLSSYIIQVCFLIILNEHRNLIFAHLFICTSFNCQGCPSIKKEHNGSILP
jgi:hypothetical protein